MPSPALSVLLLAVLAAFDSLGPGPVAVTYTCHWAFPGGTPSSSSSCSPPTVIYPSAGTKTVTLTLCSTPQGPCSTVTKTLTVLDPRPAQLTVTVAPHDLYAGDRVQLTAAVASGEPPFTYRWTLPGAKTATGNPAALDTAHLAPGVFRADVRATNRSGAASATVFLNLHDPKPKASFLLVNPATPANGDLLLASATVTGRPPLSYRWTLDSRLLASSPTLAWIVSGVTPGRHTLALAVSNALGTSAVSRNLTFTQTLIVDFAPVCPNLLCLFTVNTPVAFSLRLDPSAQPTRYEYDWIGNGSFSEASSSPVTEHIYTAPGNYRPRVRITTAFGTETRLASQFLLVTRGTGRN